MQASYICCPKCQWEPTADCRWVCDVCNTKWNTFDTHGQCPKCRKIFIDTQCPKAKGGCGEMSLNADWFVTYEVTKDDLLAPKSIWPWKNRNWLPITETDRKWTEHNLRALLNLFDEYQGKTLKTFTLNEVFLSRTFSGSEEDAFYVFDRLAALMNIEIWEIQLMFYSNKSVEYSDGITSTPSPRLKGPWSSSSSYLVNHGYGDKEIWIELENSRDPEKLIAALSYELARYKLSELDPEKSADKDLICLLAIILGAGISLGNSYFNCTTYSNTNHHGWKMQKAGYLPEQIIAYAMAWLALYRKEDMGWMQGLNKTMRRYFEQCSTYISNKQIESM